MTTIRAFIAVHLPDEVKGSLVEVAGALAGGIPRGAVRWVRPEQMHLTLRFLGETDIEKLPVIQREMDEIAERCAPLSLRLHDLGCFPNHHRPRVIWVGLAGEVSRLVAMKSALDGCLTPLGWPPENKPFQAHLTLGRVKDERAVQGIAWTADVPRLEVPVVAIHLIESRLRPDGPVYTVRHTGYLTPG